MKSRTSFFNGTVLKKDVTRFLPLWALYTVVLMLIRVFGFGNLYAAEGARRVMDTMLPLMAAVNLVYAGIVVMTLLGDLYVPRMCNALHAMPLRREGWLLTHTAAGLLMSLIPNLVFALTMLPMLKEYWYLAFVWLGGASLQYLYFFGAAMLCAVCAGSRLGMAALYGILNFITPFLYSVAELLYLPLLYGVVMNPEPMLTLCFPVMQMASGGYLYSTYRHGPSFPEHQLEIRGFIQADWNYLYILAAVGVLFLLLAVLVYRRRQLERAGDLLSVKSLTPLFLIIITLGAGTLFYFFSAMFGVKTGYVLLFAGMLVGYFGAVMLLRRTVRVFNWRSVLGYVLLAALMAGSLYATKLDPAGVGARVPEPQQVEYAMFGNYGGSLNRKITDPKELEEIRFLHRALIEEGPREASDPFRYTPDGPDIPVNIFYRLTDGSSLERRYSTRADSPVADRLRQYMSSWGTVTRSDDPEALLTELQLVSFSCWELEIYDMSYTEGDKQELLEAIRADCEAGRMAQHYAFHPDDPQVCELQLHLRTHNAPNINLSVFASCENTLRVLESWIEQMDLTTDADTQMNGN